jgi:hypothetical protein
MPATEQTWRNTKRLHLIFALSSIALLLSTLWMIAADHQREWKQYQQFYYPKLEVWSLAARLSEQDLLGYHEQEQAYQQALREAQSHVPDRMLLELLAAELVYDRREDADPSVAGGELGAARAAAFSKLQVLQSRLQSAADQVAALQVELAGQAASTQAQREALQATIENIRQTRPEAADELQRAQQQLRDLEQPLEGIDQRLQSARNELSAVLRELQPAVARFAELAGGPDVLAAEAGEAFSLHENLAAEPSSAHRTALLRALHDIRARALFEEETLQRELKFARAELDGVRSELNLRRGQGAAQQELDALQAQVDVAAAKVDALAAQFERANAHRKYLDAVLREITRIADQLQKRYDGFKLDRERLQASLEQTRDKLGKKVVGMPVLDAFNNTEIEIKQIWLPDLTINYNFKHVARFDRCVTCHLGIERTAPGSATQPAYPAQHTVAGLVLPTPKQPPQFPPQGQLTTAAYADLRLQMAYGLQLSAQGLLDPNDALVENVLPRSLAAEALLQRGDVITHINDHKVQDRKRAMELLLDRVEWGQPLRLTVRRGVPHPYSTHPRLELFGGSTSPHPFTDIGCTVCHDGQGSGTAFKWASHTPNTLGQLRDWALKYGWFDNHYWVFPMLPQRFAESNCLKCHHELAALEPSERFPDPPAPKLLAGYHLVREYGCFGCHEINGYDGPNRRIGPDLRLEPNYAAAAQALLVDPRLSEPELAQRFETVFAVPRDTDDAQFAQFRDEIQRLAAQVAADPAHDAPRRRLRDLVQADADRARRAGSHSAYLRAAMHRLLPVLEDVEVPGQLRKVGPSLRYLASKVDAQFLYNWILEPADYRPSTRMPQFFGLHSHFLPQTKREVVSRQAVLNPDSPLLARSTVDGQLQITVFRDGQRSRHELVVRLLGRNAAPDNQSYTTMNSLASALDSIDGIHAHVTPQGQLRIAGDSPLVEFTLQGTAAVFQALGLPQVASSGVPDQTRNYETIEALALVEYLHGASQPMAYHQPPAQVTEPPSAERGKFLFQTRGCLACHMHADFPQADQTQGPDLTGLGSKLTGQRGRDWLYSWLRDPTQYHARTKMPNLFLEPIAHDDGTVTDPAADITAYLLQSSTWQPRNALPDLASNPQLYDALLELARENLRGTYTQTQTESYLKEGIPPELAPELRGDEIELLGPFDTPAQRQSRLLRYVGRRTVSKYGCFACHDIPGFENAKPIGTALQDWGRKDAAKLAFEQIGRFIELTDLHPAHALGGDTHAAARRSAHGAAANHAQGAAEGHTHGEGGHAHLEVVDLPDQDQAYFLNALFSHQRMGFLWQKLRAPRSFDYETTRNKPYKDRLRMPRFPFSAQQREQVMTFILGLVAEPPAEKYLYRPDPRQQAIVEGRRLLEQYNCGGCHVLQHESYAFRYRPGSMLQDYAAQRPYPAREYPYFQQQYTSEQIAQSQQLDARGWGHARVFAQAVRDPTGALREDFGEDEQGNEVTLRFLMLWEPALIHGQSYLAGDQLIVPEPWFEPEGYRPAVGGHLAHLLYPTAVQLLPAAQRDAKYNEVWGWLPPPLVGQGRKVQTPWLHDFLLDPFEIRPAALLRMPKFNMSSAEAAALADYFAAVDGAEFPYEFDPRTRRSYLQAAEQAWHQTGKPGRLDDAFKITTSICAKCHQMGDYRPSDTIQNHAPRLDRVYGRLRPEFLKLWLANPKRLLPYTAMPVNFERDKPLAPESFQGELGPLLTHGTSEDQLQAVVDLLLNYDEYLQSRQSIKPLIQVPVEPGTPPAGTATPPGAPP